MIYTGIGSRETPPAVLTWMESFAAVMAARATLRSGGAPGADTAFERGCDRGEGAKEIYLPWKGFNGSQSALYEPSAMAYEIAEGFHPAWGRCSPAAKKLHARNTHQILGADCQSPSDVVICWTKDGKRGGGTGQALRIAESHNIPIWDLGS